MPKLTKRIVESARPGQSDLFLWDDHLPGFGLRLRPSGRRNFVVQYRTPEGRQRRRVVGRFPIMTVDQARYAAREWLASAHRGEDLAEGIDRNRRAASVADLCERFLKDHAEHHKKPRSAAEDRRLFEHCIKSPLGSRKASSVGPGDVERLHKSLNATPYQANRVLALLATVFNHAELELRRVRPEWSNPCHTVKRYKEEKRRRYLSSGELARLGEALSAAEAEGLAGAEAVAAIRLLIFTGCRRWEILSLRWDQVDIEARRLRLSDSKTGAKDVHLSPPAIEVLRGLRPIEGATYVIPGRQSGTHMRDIKDPWTQVRDRAKLKDLRLHDLRHSFASVGVGAGLSLPIIGALLGHSQPATTARYAHLASDPLQEAVDLVGARLADALAGGNHGGGDVVKLPRKRG